MSGVFQHYRLSLLGQDLKETLDELVANEMFSAEHKELVWEHFDRAIADALANQIRNKVTIRGAIKHYRNHDDIWTFFLKEIDVRLDSKALISDAKTEMIAVSKR